MYLIKVLNLSALIIGVLGSFLMYYYSPKKDSRTILYRDREEMEQVLKKDRQNNTMVRNGMLLLLISFLIQIIALVIQ